jgi:hypothetical protein
MRPDAPAEYRGEFRPISSKVPGMPMCELMPRQALIADRLAVVRTMTWNEPCHQAWEICTGFPGKAQRPSFGSILNRLYPGGSRVLPRFVDLTNSGYLPQSEDPQYVGAAYRPFYPSGPSYSDLVLSPDVSLERLGDRKRLLESFGDLRRDLDHSGEFAAKDAFTRQAYDMVTSDAVRDAFDLSKEPAHVVARYGDKSNQFMFLGQKYDFDFESFIRARRMAEAGVPFISLNIARWDHHCLEKTDGSIFASYRTLLPLYDMAISALITDLHERGLSNDVTVVVWGEFSRTPRVNKTGGRDHWPAAGSVLVAGGGLRMGQYVGETDRHAERPQTRAYNPQNLFSTLYHVMDIDPATTIPDRSGRPMYLLDDPEPIRELL